MPSLVLQSPGSIICKIGPVTLRWYGMMFAIAFMTASYFASKLAKREGIDQEKLTNLTLICFIAGVLGARLYFVALNWTTPGTGFMYRPAEILATWEGGLSIHGGIIGGFIAFWLYTNKHKLPKARIADICTTVLPLGQAIGRWGNFFNSEAFGVPVPDGFPLAVFIPPHSRPARFQSASLFHATFLYEAIWDFGIFLLLYCYLNKKLRNYPGACAWVYIALYNIGRLMIEPLRTDSIMAGEIPVPIIASIVFLVVSLCLIPYFIYKGKANAKVSDDK